MAENMNQVSNGADFQSSQSQQRTSGQSRQQQQGQHKLMQSGKQIRNDMQQLYGHVQETGEELQAYLTEQVQQRPYTVLGTAAAIGYLLGGGLSSKITLMAFGVVTRFAMALAAREMASRAATAGSGSGDSAGGPPGEGQQQWH